MSNDYIFRPHRESKVAGAKAPRRGRAKIHQNFMRDRKRNRGSLWGHLTRYQFHSIFPQRRY